MGEDEGVAAGAAPTDALQERRGEQVQMRQDGSASHAVRESQEETSSEVEKGTTEKVRGAERPATRTKAKGRKTEERIHEAQRDEAKDTTRDEGEAGTGQVGEGPSRSVDSPNSRASPRRSRLRSRDPPKPPSPSSLSSPSLHASLSAPSVVDADALEASTDLGCPHVGENETPREGEAEREEAKDETGRVRRGEPPGGYSLRARRSRARELWEKREEGGGMSRRADSAARTERLHEEEQRETETDAANGEDRGGPSRKRRVGERERRPATPARTAAGLAATERRREEVRGSSRRCCSRGRGSGGVAFSQGGAWTYAKTEGTESGSRGAGRQTPRGAAAGEKKRRQDTKEKEERKQDKESEARVESRTPRYFPASPATKARSKNAGVTLRVSAEKRKSTRAEERDASSSGKREDRPPSALGSGTPARPSSPAAGFQGKPPLHAQRQMHTGNAPCNSTSLSTPSSPASVDTIGGFPRDAFERFDQPFLQVTLTEVSSRNRWKATASYEDKVESLLKEGVARSTCFRREAPSSLTICKQYDWKNHQAMFEDEDRTTYYRKAIFWRGWEQHERRREAQSRGLRATSLLEDNFPGNVEQCDPGGEAGREDESENKDANAASMPRLHASGPREETQEAERGKKSGGEKNVGGEDVQEMTNDGVRRRVATSELAQLEGTSNCRLFREERRLGDARGLSGVETQDEDEESGEEELDDGVVDVKSFRPCSGSLEDEEEGERGVKKKRTYVQGKRVLEIGTGPIALLAVLAVKAGAEYVDALEVSKTSASLATSFVRQFGLNSSASRYRAPSRMSLKAQNSDQTNLESSLDSAPLSTASCRTSLPHSTTPALSARVSSLSVLPTSWSSVCAVPRDSQLPSSLEDSSSTLSSESLHASSLSSASLPSALLRDSSSSPSPAASAAGPSAPRATDCMCVDDTPRLCSSHSDVSSSATLASSHSVRDCLLVPSADAISSSSLPSLTHPPLLPSPSSSLPQARCGGPAGCASLPTSAPASSSPNSAQRLVYSDGPLLPGSSSSHPSFSSSASSASSCLSLSSFPSQKASQTRARKTPPSAFLASPARPGPLVIHSTYSKLFPLPPPHLAPKLCRDVFPACSLSPSTSTLARASPATPAALSTPSSPSTSLSPHAPASFPCYYDMVIHEILGDFASQEGAADVYLDIQRRLGYCPKSIPTAATTCVAPCAFPTRENIPYKATDHPERTIFSPRRRLFQSVSLQFSSLLLCESLLPMEELRFEEPMERQMLQRRRLEFTVTRRGLFAGFLAAIDVEIRPGRHFGTVFEQQCDSWYTNVVLLGKEIEVRPRDRITLFTIADLKNYQVETVPQSVGKKKQAVQMEVSRPTYTFQGYVERPRQGVVAEFGPIHIDYDEQASCIRIE
ncbi:hypothetical protein TGP89_207100 [Toxoplasma gondii p89]|uniref:Uncharacterized protein n=2 Tax=Toxoplasma gondii TaxID=5811 RepID=A0A086J6V9_TOXGO|nr:hypothetical protein TGP89_207100 [Toxoplasma gondii p89]